MSSTFPTKTPSGFIKWTLLLAFSLFVAIMTQKSIGGPIDLTIDSSWEFALNYFQAQHLVIGKDVYFTHGPLGFLIFPKPINNHLFIAALVWFFLKFILIIHVIQLALKLNDEEIIWYKLLVSMLAVFFFAAININLLLFLTVTWLLLFNVYQRKYYLYLATALSLFTLLIKPGLALYNVIAIYSFLLVDGFFRKRYRLLLEITLAHIGLYFIIWLLITHSFSGSLVYLSSSLEFIRGYDSAMSLSPANNWTFLTGAVLLVCLSFIPFLGRKLLAKNGLIIFLILIIPCCLLFKYSYNRENQHIYNITVFLFLFYSYMLILIGSFRRFSLLLLLAIGAIQFQLASQRYLGYSSAIFYPDILSSNYFIQQIVHPVAYKNSLLTLSEKKLKDINIDLHGINLEQASFDIYPSYLSIIFAKQLKWQPRPIAQAYTSYTSNLDNMNAEFFKKNKGADYLIWHAANNLSEIDQRYLLNSEPNTVFEIFNNYRVLKTLDDYAILKKTPEKKWSEPTIFHRNSSTWNQWISVPINSFDMIRARLLTEETWLEKIKRTVYKQGSVTIDYQFNNAAIESYRLILATARNGVWIKPFIHALSNQVQAETGPLPKTSEATTAKYAIEQLAFINGFLLVTGWGYIENTNTLGQFSKLILSKDGKHYFFPTVLEARSDISRLITKFNFDPEYLGFQSKINLQGLATGNYQLELYFFNADKKVVVHTGKILKITAKEKQQSDVVEKIRIRHEPDDFFHETIDIEWLGAYLKTERK